MWYEDIWVYVLTSGPPLAVLTHCHPTLGSRGWWWAQGYIAGGWQGAASATMACQMWSVMTTLWL